MKIIIENKSREIEKEKEKIIEKIAKKIVEEEGYEIDKVKINLIDDNEIKKINKKYLNRNYYTDVITFSEIKKRQISGEVYISIERVKENSKKYNKPFNNEFYRVIVHSILHLCNYNDYNKSEKIKIRKKENYYIKKIDENEL